MGVSFETSRRDRYHWSRSYQWSRLSGIAKDVVPPRQVRPILDERTESTRIRHALLLLGALLLVLLVGVGGVRWEELATHPQIGVRREEHAIQFVVQLYLVNTSKAC